MAAPFSDSSVVQNQGHCGSCWAFGTVASVEGVNKIKHGTLVSLSEQQLVDCDTRDDGCQGGDPDRALGYVESVGLTTEASYPYYSGSAVNQSSRTVEIGGCQQGKISKTIKINGYNTVRGEAQLAAAVAQQPAVVCIDGSSIQHYGRPTSDYV